MDERIVVGVDGSESSRRALRWAARQAKFTGASLEVVIAWEVPPDYRFDASSPHDLRLGAESILQSAVADVLGDDPDVDVKPSVVEGHPVPVLRTQQREHRFLSWAVGATARSPAYSSDP